MKKILSLLYYLVQERLFEEFFSFSYPCEYLSLKVFNEIIISRGLNEKKANDYFRAFDIGQKYCLNFNDYLLGNFYRQIKRNKL